MNLTYNINTNVSWQLHLFWSLFDCAHIARVRLPRLTRLNYRPAACCGPEPLLLLQYVGTASTLARLIRSSSAAAAGCSKMRERMTYDSRCAGLQFFSDRISTCGMDLKCSDGPAVNINDQQGRGFSSGTLD